MYEMPPCTFVIIINTPVANGYVVPIDCLAETVNKNGHLPYMKLCLWSIRYEDTLSCWTQISSNVTSTFPSIFGLFSWFKFVSNTLTLTLIIIPIKMQAARLEHQKDSFLQKGNVRLFKYLIKKFGVCPTFPLPYGSPGIPLLQFFKMQWKFFSPWNVFCEEHNTLADSYMATLLLIWAPHSTLGVPVFHLLLEEAVGKALSLSGHSLCEGYRVIV